MGRKKALCREWLTRGVRVAAAAGGADGRAGWAGLRAMQGWLAGRAGCEALFFSFLFLFYFSSLCEFKFDLEFEFKSGVPHPLDYLDVRPTTLLYILGSLFSYFV